MEKKREKSLYGFSAGLILLIILGVFYYNRSLDNPPSPQITTNPFEITEKDIVKCANSVKVNPDATPIDVYKKIKDYPEKLRDYSKGFDEKQVSLYEKLIIKKYIGLNVKWDLKITSGSNEGKFVKFHCTYKNQTPPEVLCFISLTGNKGILNLKLGDMINVRGLIKKIKYYGHQIVLDAVLVD